MPVRTIDVRERVMAKNDELAAGVRARLRDAGVPTFAELDIAVITGDVQTQNDADRLARHTDRLVQAVVTNGACHLDARQVATALDAIDLVETDLLFIENVGNLVCPASWDLGEDAKVVLFSVTEGEDKPAKYPKMFREARVCVFTKMDLLAHVPFSVVRATGIALDVNPELQFLYTSALQPAGMDEWYGFLRARARRASAA